MCAPRAHIPGEGVTNPESNPPHPDRASTRDPTSPSGRGTQTARPRRDQHDRDLRKLQELLSLNQLCQRNCCGLRADPCEITTLTSAGPRKSIASSRAPGRSFGSSTKKPLPPKASMTLS